MLFIFNGKIIRVDNPDAHVDKHWKRIGAGDPDVLTSEDAEKFVSMAMKDYSNEDMSIDDTTLTDLAALTLYKIGANTIEINSLGELSFHDTPEKTLRAMAKNRIQQRTAG